MRINIERDVLLKPLNLLSGVVEKRQTLPILANVHMALEDGDLTLVGTDIEIEITAKVAGVKGVDGECTLTARKLLDICRALPEQSELQIDVKEDKALMKSGKSRFTLQTLPAKDFPKLKRDNWQETVLLKKNVLKDLIEKTAFSMAHQDVRYYLNGLLFEFQSQLLRSVATDGHRLAKSDVSLEGGVSETRQVIVPRKAVIEMSRLMDSDEGEVSVSINDNHIQLTTGNTTFISKLIDGRFPDYNEVMSPVLNVGLTLNKNDFREILARAAILTNDKFRGIRLNVSKNLLKVTAHNPEQEEAVDEMPIEYEGEEIEIGFNVTYLMDSLKALESENVEFRLNDPNSSCTINAEGNQTTQYLIMPMRI